MRLQSHPGFYSSPATLLPQILEAKTIALLVLLPCIFTCSAGFGRTLAGTCSIDMAGYVNLVPENKYIKTWQM